MLLRLAILSLVLTGCGALDALVGVEEHEVAAECQQVVVQAAPDSTVPEHVRQYYPQVTLVLTSCPTK